MDLNSTNFVSRGCLLYALPVRLPMQSHMLFLIFLTIVWLMYQQDFCCIIKQHLFLYDLYQFGPEYTNMLV